MKSKLKYHLEQQEEKYYKTTRQSKKQPHSKISKQLQKIFQIHTGKKGSKQASGNASPDQSLSHTKITQALKTPVNEKEIPEVEVKQHPPTEIITIVTPRDKKNPFIQNTQIGFGALKRHKLRQNKPKKSTRIIENIYKQRLFGFKGGPNTLYDDMDLAEYVQYKNGEMELEVKEEKVFSRKIAGSRKIPKALKSKHITAKAVQTYQQIQKNQLKTTDQQAIQENSEIPKNLQENVGNLQVIITNKNKIPNHEQKQQIEWNMASEEISKST